MKKDELKDIFDAAFAQEAIPVDVANWDMLSAALDQRSRRKALYYWLMGLGALFLAAVSSMAVWPFSQPPAYHPDHVSSFSSMDHLPQGECLPFYNSVSHNPLTEGDTKELDKEVAHSAQPESKHGATFTEPQPTAQAGSLAESQTSIHSSTSQLGLASRLTTTSSDSDELDAASVVDSAITNEARPKDFLEKIPLRQAHVDPTIMVITERDIDTMDEKRPWEAYVRAGVTFGESIAPGQVGGIGISAHIRDNLLFGSELLLVRDFVSLESAMEAQTYGYERYQQAILIQASEILSTELPIFVRYRWNRISIGGGLSASYVIGARLTERHYLRSSKTAQPWASHELSEELDVGYVRWKAVKPFRLSAATDLSYQLTDRYYVGSRISFPLQDVFTSNAVNDRFIRLELYLKMSLKP